jgi:hypothetical protein
MGTPMKACICEHAKAFHRAKSGAAGLVWACNFPQCGCQKYRWESERSSRSRQGGQDSLRRSHLHHTTRSVNHSL